jgi:hypothetical protein
MTRKKAIREVLEALDRFDRLARLHNYPGHHGPTELSEAFEALDGARLVLADAMRPRAGALEPVDVPPELLDLPLYAADYRLCKRWSEVFPLWRASYRGVDVMAQVRNAHAWEVSNPERRKVNRARFLNAWLARAQDRQPVKTSNLIF